MLIGEVRAETLKVSDSNGGVPHLKMDTLRLALFLLRADTTAHSGQRGTLFDDRCGSEHIARLQFLDEARDVDVHRTALYAGRILAVEAAVALHDRLVKSEPLVHFFVQRFDAHFGTQFRHLDALYGCAVFRGSGEGFHRPYLGLTLALTVA